MIFDSSLFKSIVNSYIPEDARQHTLKTIFEYEKSILKRTPLEQIKGHNYDSCLNASIDMIEKSVYIMSWINQLKHNIKIKKNLKEKEYTLEKFRLSKHIDSCDLLSEITSKTEKQKVKQLMMEENLVDLDYELETLKTEFSVAELYVKDAEELNKLVYAYYQAIKNKEVV